MKPDHAPAKRSFFERHERALLCLFGHGARAVNPSVSICDVLMANEGNYRGDGNRGGAQSDRSVDPDLMVEYGRASRALVRMSFRDQKALELAWGDYGAAAIASTLDPKSRWRAVTHLTGHALAEGPAWVRAQPEPPHGDPARRLAEHLEAEARSKVANVTTLRAWIRVEKEALALLLDVQNRFAEIYDSLLETEARIRAAAIAKRKADTR